MIVRLLPAVVWILFGQAATTQPPPSAGAQFAPHEGLIEIRWDQAREYVDRHCAVVGRLITARTSAGGCNLYFDRPGARGLRLFVRRDAFARFDGPLESLYPGRWVRATGLIQEFQGEPELRLFSPAQIQVLPDEPAKTLPPRVTRAAEGVVTIGTYNVLNLFDEFDDPYTADEGTPPKPRPEMERLAETIRRLNADVLALQEVENRGVLQRFVRALLPDLGYEHVVLFEGNDERGIDCALLSRLPVGTVTSYRHLSFPVSDGGTTRFRRDLLRVRFEPPGAAPFDLFVVHLKSKRGEMPESPSIRQAEAREIRRIVDGLFDHDPAPRFIICGDFNDTWDSPALRTIVGGGPTALRSFADELSEDQRVTYNREPYRSMIDYILCSPAMAGRYVSGSFRIIDGSIENNGSDHNPLAASFRLGGQSAEHATSASTTTAPASSGVQSGGF